MSLVGGGNDLLRPTADVDRMARNLEAAVVRLREAGVDVLLGTGVDAADSPLIKATRSRVAIYNALIWSMARRHGAYVVDLWGMRSLRDWRMWAEDRIHLTTDGHARVAQAALVGLGLSPTTPAGTTRSPPCRPRPGCRRPARTPPGCASTSTRGRPGGCAGRRRGTTGRRSGRSCRRWSDRQGQLRSMVEGWLLA